MQITPAILIPSIIATLVLSACGGGGSNSVAALAATPLPSVNSANSGTISGLGSIVVNGVRYETIGAKVSDIDDQTINTSPLRLGMTVSVEQNGVDPTTNRPVADRVSVERGIKGIATLDTAGKLTVAGLPVRVDSRTYIIGSDGQIASNYVGQFVEIYGLPQADGSFVATLIEVKSAAEPVSLVGTVSNLDMNAKTFTLGTGTAVVSVSFADISVPSTLTNGAVVSIRTSVTAPTASAAGFTATRLYVRAANSNVFKTYESRYSGTSKASSEVNELYGIVSGKKAASTGCSLQIQSVLVTFNSSALCASLNDGDYVEAKGVLSNGVLAATRIEFKSANKVEGYKDDSEDSDNDGLRYRDLTSGNPTIGNNIGSGSIAQSLTASAFEAYGTLNCLALNASCTLQIGGVNYPADLSTARWDDGASVLNGVVEVKGYLSAGTFVVSKIESKNGRN